MTLVDRAREKLNVNSWISIGGFLLTIAIQIIFVTVFMMKMNSGIEANAKDIEKLQLDTVQRWQTHESYHREKAADNSGIVGRMDERIKAVERQNIDIANLQYRTTNLEGQVKDFSSFQSEIRKQMGDIATAVELIKQTMLSMKEASPRTRM